jgi:hypothetical protein
VEGDVVLISFDEINAFREGFNESGFCSGIVFARDNCSSDDNSTTCLQDTVYNAMVE